MQTMKKLFLILSVAAGLVSCEDFLTAGDPNKIDAPSYFRNESDLEAYANGFLQTMIPTAISVATGDARADYMAWRGEWQYLTDNFDADDQSGWSTGSWEDLRNINYFLGNFRRAAAGEAILDHYEGVARFWRAYFYMNKVKTFGAVPWYDREIDANDREALYKPRDSREYVMRKVLEDLDFASTHCITNAKLEVNSVRITRNVALAFKARCCLYEGTFRKYHANDPSTGKPWTADESEMYLRACADACETLMGEGKYALVSDPAKVATQYRSLFTSESVASGEVIWARAYDASLNATHILNTYFVNMQYGSYSLTRQFVNTYLNRDGSRFTDKAGYEKTLFADEFENRDYRLMQSIRYPGYTRRNNNVNTPYAPDFGYCVTGYQPIKWVIDDTSMDSNTAPCATCIPILRYAEVLLNYAEAKAELGEFSETVWNATIKLLRERAGVDGAMPSAYDPYMAEYFLNTTTDMAILDPPRTRHRTAARKLPLGRRHALGYGTAAGTPVVRGLCGRTGQGLRHGRRRFGRRLLRARKSPGDGAGRDLPGAGRRLCAYRRRQRLYRVLHPHEPQVGRQEVRAADPDHGPQRQSRAGPESGLEEINDCEPEK